MNPEAQVLHIVDDDASFARALSRFLKAAGFEARAYPSANAFLEALPAAADACPCGCVLLDLNMPGLNGLELQEVLGRRASALGVVFLTGQGDIPSTVQAMRLGAEDFLTKQASQQEILEAVRRALGLSAKRLQQQRARAHRETLLAGLSPREQDVLREVVSGKLNKQIADTLGISERTVKLHRTNLTSKLGLYSVAELTRFMQDAPPPASNPAASAASIPAP